MTELATKVDILVECFRQGDKELILEIDEDGFALTGISKIPDAERLSGSTTEVYTKAREYLQTEAEKQMRPIHYRFRTSNESMVSWAENKGQEIFEWDMCTLGSTGVDGVEKKTFTGIKVFYPSS